MNEIPIRDIHFPAPIKGWPIAYGWYILGILFFLISLSVLLYLKKRNDQRKPAKEALKILEHIRKAYQITPHANETAAAVSELLKRVSIAYYPIDTVAACKGQEWISFLNKESKGLDFSKVTYELLELPYTNQREANLQPLFEMTEAWIRQRRKKCLP